MRVCVHRLRKALDAIYGDHHGPWLRVLKGEYSIVLAKEAGNLKPSRLRSPPRLS